MFFWVAGYLAAAAMLYVWMLLTAKPNPYEGEAPTEVTPAPRAPVTPRQRAFR